MSTTDADFGALGRFVYEFSRLVDDVRVQLARISTAGNPPEFRAGRLYEALWLHTGDMGAYELANVYFAVAELFGDYTPEEAKIAARLRKQLGEFITMRNDIMHGEWMIGWGSTTGVADPVTGEVHQVSKSLPPTLTRTKAARRSGSKNRQDEYTAEQLEKHVAALHDLRETIFDWGRLIDGWGWTRITKASAGAPPPDPPRRARPGDVYVLRGSEVVREGPLARWVTFIPLG